MGINTIDQPFWIEYAINQIERDYGDKVSIIDKSKNLRKFGRNDDLSTTEEIVMLQGGIEVLPTTNSIDSLISNNAADTQNVIVEGHYFDTDNNKIFIVQSLNLNGLTRVPLPTPLCRATRVYNNSNINFVGTVQVYEDGGVIAVTTDGSNNQSLKCATAVSSTDYWIINSFSVAVNRQQTRSVDFKLQIAEDGKVFRTRQPISANSSGGNVPFAFEPYLIIPKNADMRVTAISSGAGTGVTATVQGVLAKVIS